MECTVILDDDAIYDRLENIGTDENGQLVDKNLNIKGLFLAEAWINLLTDYPPNFNESKDAYLKAANEFIEANPLFGEVLGICEALEVQETPSQDTFTWLFNKA